MEDLMTAEEVASYLHLCKKTVYSLAKQMEIPSIKIGTNLRFSRADIDQALKHSTDSHKQFLVIDDSPAIVDLVKQMLEPRGHHVLTAGTGCEAVELVKTYKFDRIFLDLGLPDMDGAETLRQIRLIDPGVTVIVITGDPDSDIMKRTAAQGVSRVIEKPFKLANVMEAIEAIAA